MANSRILITEDEGIVALDLQSTLEGMGYTVVAVTSSGEEAIKAAEETQPDLVLMDIMLAGEMDGITAAEHIHGQFHIPVIFLTAYADQQILERAKRAEPYGYIIKPFKEEREVHIAIEMALHKLEMERELAKYREHLEEVVAERTAELKESNEQFLQSQKMESIGRLAGGIAHDFNNLLTPIMGYAQLGMAKLPAGDALSNNFEEILKSAEHASKLTRQLLSFSRRQVIEPKVIDLNDLLTNVDQMLRRLIGEDIEFLIRPADDLSLVEADPVQIEQVLINLAVNARHAMPYGGRITIETGNVVLGTTGGSRPDAPAGPYVVLSVTDTGVGMTAEVKSHIFEPFFTTKEKGKGTGLGLSTCYGIVRQAGGHIEVSSDPGEGATFRVYLPRTDAARPEPDLKDDAVGLPPGTETVLLAEDEPSVRKMAAHVLRNQGYTVLEAANGAEALRVAAEGSNEDIRLLMTDVVMPQMGGRELADRFRSRYHGVKVLFTSGYVDLELDWCQRPGYETSFLQKPFLPDALAHKVREALDK
jgi:signal transduction histidine kinase